MVTSMCIFLVPQKTGKKYSKYISSILEKQQTHVIFMYFIFFFIYPP